MNKLRRIYNQNTKEIWMVIMIIIFIISIIQLLNLFAKEQLQKDIEESKNSNQIEKKYKNESVSIVSGGSVSEYKQEEYGTLIDNFLKNCSEGNVEEAYKLLSNDCKKLLYSSQEIFKSKYCDSKFSGNKTYSFQSWSSANEIIYHVKIFDNLLSSGIANTRNYMEDYITIVREDNQYRLNVNNYIKKRIIEAEKEKDNIKISVNNSRVYMDYEIYSITIENKTGSDVLLDSRKKTDTIYVKDNNTATYEALLYENQDDDLIIQAGMKKTIEIKFSNSYQSESKMKQIYFSDIVKDYEEYQKNSDEYEEIIQIEIDF